MPGENAEYPPLELSDNSDGITGTGTVLSAVFVIGGGLTSIVFWPVGVPLLLTGLLIAGGTYAYHKYSKEKTNTQNTQLNRTNSTTLHRELSSGEISRNSIKKGKIKRKMERPISKQYQEETTTLELTEKPSDQSNQIRPRRM